jgi:rare lipoprotein A (peptidoglycan hydrolase)
VGVKDRGPYAGDRGLDLSQAAKKVGLNAVGADEVDVRVVASSVGYGSTTSISHEGKDREEDSIPGNAALLLARSYLRILGTSSTPYSKSSPGSRR